jgi:uncharacterized protein (DUF1330 family)
MPGYVIAEVTVTDPLGFEEYRRLVPSTIARYGGRYVVRGGKTETLEGDWQPTRLVVLEFDSVERARQWWAPSVSAQRARSSSSSKAPDRPWPPHRH